jgi:glycosyltransferase involved in cell wall biosynthesis
MNLPPEVSVVMSVFNGRPFLREAVEGILKQTFRDFEFIVVDDASADGSWEILESLAAADPRMVLMRNGENLGVARSRNAAIAVARGRFLACQDADDVSLPGRLASQVRFMDANPDVGLLGTMPEFIDEAGRVIPSSNYPQLFDNGTLQERLPDTNCFCAGSVMLRRELLAAVGDYDQDLAPSEDYDLWLRVAEVTRLANLPQRLYLYRRHSGSASTNWRYLQMQNKAIALERAMERRYAGRTPAEDRRLLARDFLRAAAIGFFSGEGEKARGSLKRATLWAPELADSGTLVEDVVGRYLLREPIPSALAACRSIFAELLPETRHLGRVRSRIAARLHMRRVFDGNGHASDASRRQHLWAAVREDPRWLANRGVWAIGVRELLGIRRDDSLVAPVDEGQAFQDGEMLNDP